MNNTEKVKIQYYAVFKDGKYIEEDSLKDIKVSHYDYLFRRESRGIRTKLYLINDKDERDVAEFGKYEISKIEVGDWYKSYGYRIKVSILDLEKKKLHERHKSISGYTPFGYFFTDFFTFMNRLVEYDDWDKFQEIQSLKDENKALKEEITNLKKELGKKCTT